MLPQVSLHETWMAARLLRARFAASCNGCGANSVLAGPASQACRDASDTSSQSESATYVLTKASRGGVRTTRPRVSGRETQGHSCHESSFVRTLRRPVVVPPLSMRCQMPHGATRPAAPPLSMRYPNLSTAARSDPSCHPAAVCEIKRGTERRVLPPRHCLRDIKSRKEQHILPCRRRAESLACGRPCGRGGRS